MMEPALTQFDRDNKALSNMCKEVCYDCSATVLTSCPKSFVRQEVEKLYGGGANKTTKKTTKKPPKKTTKKTSTTRKSTTQKTNKPKKKRKAATVDPKQLPAAAATVDPKRLPEKPSKKSVATKEDCPEWNAEKRCVHEYDDKDTCVPDEEVIGYGTTELSDGHCYRHETMKKHPGKGSIFVDDHEWTEKDLKIMSAPLSKNEEIIILKTTRVAINEMGSKVDTVKAQLYKLVEGADLETAEAMLKQLQETEGTRTWTNWAMDKAKDAGKRTIKTILPILTKVIGWMTSGAIWIVNHPTQAMFWVFMIKAFIQYCCRMYAVQKMEMQYVVEKTGFDTMSRQFSDVMRTFGEGANLSMGGLLRAGLEGKNWEGLWNGCKVKLTAMGGSISEFVLPHLSVVPVLGMMMGPIGSVAHFVTMVGVDALEAATRTAVRVAAYRKDIETVGDYLIDIYEMLINFNNCAKKYGKAFIASCDKVQGFGTVYVQNCERTVDSEGNNMCKIETTKDGENKCVEDKEWKQRAQEEALNNMETSSENCAGKSFIVRPGKIRKHYEPINSNPHSKEINQDELEKMLKDNTGKDKAGVRVGCHEALDNYGGIKGGVCVPKIGGTNWHLRTKTSCGPVSYKSLSRTDSNPECWYDDEEKITDEFIKDNKNYVIKLDGEKQPKNEFGFLGVTDNVLGLNTRLYDDKKCQKTTVYDEAKQPHYPIRLKTFVEQEKKKMDLPKEFTSEDRAGFPGSTSAVSQNVRIRRKSGENTLLESPDCFKTSYDSWDRIQFGRIDDTKCRWDKQSSRWVLNDPSKKGAWKDLSKKKK